MKYDKSFTIQGQLFNSPETLYKNTFQTINNKLTEVNDHPSTFDHLQLKVVKNDLHKVYLQSCVTTLN